MKIRYMCGSKKICITYYGIIWVLSFLLLPVFLNWILQWDVTDCKIIAGQDGASALWLGFWGSYLAAIGAFVMAWVSYKQNQNEGRRNILRMEYERARDEYNSLEQYVISQYHLHSSYKFTSILYILETKGKDGIVDAKYAQATLLNELNNTSLYAARLKHSIDEKYTEYGKIICNYNIKCIDQCIELRKFIDNFENTTDIDMSIKNVIDKINNNLNESELSNASIVFLIYLQQQIRSKWEVMHRLS